MTRKHKNKSKNVSASMTGEPSASSSKSEPMTTTTSATTAAVPAKELASEHLPPLLFVFTIMICSGMMMVFAFRDVFATGKIVGGSWDEQLMSFTKSMDWFDDSKGWKSQQGGLSAIRQYTSDANNMGGFFVRKTGGAMALAVHAQKMLPMIFHPLDARWKQGHFAPLLWTGVVGNLAIVTFYATYLADLTAAGADALPKLLMIVLAVEAMVMAYFAYTTSRNAKTSRRGAIAMTEGKTPRSVPSRIVTRTVTIISTIMGVIAARDLFAPGFIFDFIPRDDIYLEWTNAFLHSPPEGTLESETNAMSSSLYIGDKFVSQFLGLHLLIAVLYKFVTAYVIRYGNDGRGMIQARMIWKAQTLGDALLLAMFRLFAPAAMSASLDLRWHLMCVGYETLILGLYGYL